MKLHDLYEQYLSGKLDKRKYIKMMHKKHQILFDYFDYIKETDIGSITIDRDSIYITVKDSGVKMFLDKFDSRFIPIEMLNFHSIEPQEKKLVLSLASSCPTIFDIGANIGWYSLNFNLLPKVKRICAFEPISYTYDYLKKHILINDARKVSAFNFGLSDVAGEKIFYWTKGETGSSSMVNLRNRHKINKIKCKTATMDEFMKNRQYGPDFIKCDVEGAELFVFKGGVNTLKKYKPIIFTEMLRKWSKKFGYHPDDIINLLSGLGYQCYGYVNNKIKKIDSVDSEMETTNFFFFHDIKHKNIISSLFLDKISKS